MIPGSRGRGPGDVNNEGVKQIQSGGACQIGSVAKMGILDQSAHSWSEGRPAG